MTTAPSAALSDRRRLAYEKLGIDPAAIADVPPISPQLRTVARLWHKYKLPESPYYYLKCSELPEAQAVARFYYLLPKSQRDLVPIEGYCLAASVSSNLILGIIHQSSQRIAAQSSALIAAVSHPRVVEKTVRMALTDEGIEDRRDLHKAVGFLPTPKGSRTTVNVVAEASATSASASQATAEAPPPERTIRRLVDRFNEARGLPPARTMELPAADADADADLPSLPAREPVAIEDDTGDDSP